MDFHGLGKEAHTKFEKPHFLMQNEADSKLSILFNGPIVFEVEMNKPPFSSTLSTMLLRHPFALGLCLTAVTVFVFAAAATIRVESGDKIFYGEDDPVYATNQQIEKKFGQGERLVIIYRSANLFSFQTLDRVRKLGEQIESLHLPLFFGGSRYLVEKVKSLTTIKDVSGRDESFSSTPLVPDPIPDDLASLEKIKQRAYANPLIRDTLISNDGNYGMMVIHLSKDLSDQMKTVSVPVIRKIIQWEEKKHQDIQYQLSGIEVAHVDAKKNQVDDLIKFSIFSYLCMFALFFVFVRKTVGVLVGIVMGTINMVSGIAILAVIGGSIGPISTMIPPILMAITASVYLHYTSVYGKNLQELPPEQAGQQALTSLIAPVFYSQFTTAIGFGSFVTSEIPMLSTTGLAIGGGIMITCVVGTLILAIFFRSKISRLLVSSKGLGSSKRFDPLLEKFATLSIHHYKTINVIALISFVVVGYGIFKLDLNHDGLKDSFRENDPIYIATVLADKEFDGSRSIVVSIKKKVGTFLEPAELKKLEDLSAFVMQRAEIKKTFSILNYVKFMNREYNDGQPEFYRIPDSTEQIAQLMLLLGGDDGLWEFTDTEYQWIRFVARTKIHDSKTAMTLVRALDGYLAEHFSNQEGYSAIATGPVRLSGELSHTLLNTFASSFSSSFVVVSILIFLVFRSFRLGLIGIVPNLYPLVLMMGILGWLGVHLNIYLIGATTITLGIVDDNTIHFLHYARERYSTHEDMPRTIKETFWFDGMAMIGTSFLMCLGFLILLTSNLIGMRWLGIIVCVAMILALFAALAILPSVLMLLRNKAGLKRLLRLPK